jgi:hypothetical protein
MHKLNQSKLLGKERTTVERSSDAWLVPLTARLCVFDSLFADRASSDSKLTTDTDGVTFGGSAPGERLVTSGREP